MIFSTHDMDIAERMCDTIFMIYRGRKVLDGTLAAIQSHYGRRHVAGRAWATVPLRSRGCPACSVLMTMAAIQSSHRATS